MALSRFALALIVALMPVQLAAANERALLASSKTDDSFYDWVRCIRGCLHSSFGFRSFRSTN